MNGSARRTTGRLAVPLVGLAPGLRRANPFELQAEVVPRSDALPAAASR